MAGEYETEEQQVEALKAWWRNNGSAIGVGVVLGLAAIFGWRYWESSQLANAQDASRQFYELSQLEGEQVFEAAAALRAAHGDSAYAVGAATVAAKNYIDAGNLDKAIEELRWALDNAPDTYWEHVLRIRLARVLLADAQTSEVLQVLDGNTMASFVAMTQELRGDALLAQGDTAGARAAYGEARDSDSVGFDTRLLDMKYYDLESQS